MGKVHTPGHDKKLRSLSGPQSLMEILLKGFEQLGWDKGRELLILRKSWKEIVGDYLHKHTVPVRIAGDTLFIAVDNNIIMQQLNMERERLKENMEKVIGRSWRIKLFLLYRKRAKSNRTRRELTEKEKLEIEGIIGHLKDRELRESFRRIIIALKSHGR